MQIDIKAKEQKPVRQTYSHIARRFGEDKPATRYQEGVLDIQATEHFHYRPTWQPDKELYDPSRTALKMEDWYKFLDPRQYYYGNYCMTRAKQQDSAEQNFKFVEKRDLMSTVPEAVKEQVKRTVLPLRHYEWGANMNNTQICAMGYGTAITSTAMLQAADRLGNAQYITRIALGISENDAAIIDETKALWMEDAAWQGMRKMVEDSLVVEDWFELFVAQNLVMDGLVHPVLFSSLEDKLNQEGGSTYSMLTEFIVEWYGESARWVDKQIAVATAESDENKKLVGDWFNKWLSAAEEALSPLANSTFGDGQAVLSEAVEALKARAAKNGVMV
ncbi:MAG: aromatic/alkene monooxygenase hydroxylase subunit beta [Candidatus Sedimenticola sp. 1PA]